MDILNAFTTFAVPVVAILAFLLSVYNTYCRWKESRPNISMEFYYLEKYLETIGEIPYYSYRLVVKNLGNVNIILDYSGIKWKNQKYIRQYYGNTFFEDYNNFPYKLVPGATLSIDIASSDLKHEWGSEFSGTVKIIGFVKLGNGQIYYSSPILVDLN